ncbi:unnamed protein product [Cylicocyclus nassatus]|uniref:Uncharacterized protein n=1 Tax=Cylicocyclus nassatus TaxID=53992 RepID=A0AA36HA61_CYLNA|nr:unnamed protein product [Cylicocyclus nassatus]
MKGLISAHCFTSNVPHMPFMILLVLLSVHFTIGSDEEPECWFETNRWDGFARNLDSRIPAKIEQDTGKKINMNEPVMAVQMEEKKDEASYILVLAQVEGEKKALCFKGHVKDQQVLSMKLDDNCVNYLQTCPKFGLPKGFIREWKAYIAQVAKA